MIVPLVPFGETTGCQFTGGVRLLVLNKSRFETDADHDRSMLSPRGLRPRRAGVKIVSTNQLDALKPELPLMKPRARTRAAGGMLNPPSCQPPGIGEPTPALTQSSPSAEKSKVVCETSGLVPPRSHVIIDPSWLKL